jgi:hypothetical protein
MKKKSDDFSAIESSSEKLLSSKYPGNQLYNVFFGQAYAFHPGTYHSGIGDKGRDKTSVECGMDMGDKHLFVQNPDILTLGCSFTQMGDLPSWFNWARIIEHTQGLTVNNCSQSSSGVNFEIAFAMDVMKRYGYPKKIYALFPNLDRAILPKQQGKNSVELSNVDWNQDISGYTTRNEHVMSRLISKNSQDEFYVSLNKNRKMQVPPEVIIFQSFILIDVLETMCKAAGIEFLFSSWHPREIETFRNLNYESYVHPKEFTNLNKSSSPLLPKWQEDIKKNPEFFVISNADSEAANLNRGVRIWEIFGVHGRDTCNHEPQTEIQDRFWIRALDGKHSGLHDQIHIAEHFLQKEITNTEISTLPEPLFPASYYD